MDGDGLESGTSTEQLRGPRSTTLSRPPGALINSTNGDGDCCCWCGDWGVAAAIALDRVDGTLACARSPAHTLFGVYLWRKGEEEEEERGVKMGDR